LALVSLLVSVLPGCERAPSPAPLGTLRLGTAEADALARMNAAGSVAFAGWTWRYEFGSGCTFRISKRYEGRPVSKTDHVLSDHQLETIAYSGAGFGVKAKPRKGGTVDLFDARDEVEARDFAADASALIASCSRP